MWFTVYIRRKSSDGTYANNIFTYDNEDSANHQFHATMSTYGMDPTYDYVRCFVMNEFGGITKNDVADHRQTAAE